ncbi:uncharacterized protein [Engystomops pustulosus]
MDLQAREMAWNSQFTSIFSDSNDSIANDDFSKLSSELINAHKSITRLWWNIRSLEEYLRLKIFPRGLRTQIFPSWEVDLDEKSNWERGLSQCSLILVNMLLDHDRGLLNQQRELIKKLESRLISFDTTSLVEPFRKKLKEMIEGYEKNILTKQNKLQRDKKDYERGRAYHWTHRGNKRRHYPPAPRSHAIGGTNLIDTQSSENSESENSQDDASASSHNARKRGPRHRDWSPSYKREKTRRGKKESREGN